MIELGEIMSPKEYADYTVKEFKNHSQQSIDDYVIKEFNSRKIEYTGSKFAAMMKWSKDYHAKQCALIAVDSIIISSRMLVNHYVKTHGTKAYIDIMLSKDLTLTYFREVKKEIERL